MKEFFRELRQRSVVKVAIAYLVVAWLVLQLADVIFPALNLPDWAITLALALLAIGFPVSLVLAWAYDISPRGIRRAASPHDPAPVAENTPDPSAGDFGEPEASGRAEALDRSIAVLPLADMSPEHDHGHFCDGLTEELINALTTIPGLRVASRTSTFAFKDKSADLSTIATKLRVAYILEGSVRKYGDKVRIVAQLIEVPTDAHLWSQTYDRELTDIFAIQDDIGARVLDALKLKLGTGHLSDSTTENARAYEYYLRGRGYFQTKTATDLDRAVDMFDKATRTDPEFVRAWADLAEASTVQALFLSAGPKAAERAENASRKAMEVAPDRAESHLSRGVALLAARKYAESEPRLLRALELDPGLIKAWHYLARAAHHQGKTAQELEYFTKATELDPEDWESPLLSIGPNLAAGDRQEALRMATIGVERTRRHLEDYPDNPRAYCLAVHGLVLLGEMDEANSYAEKALEIAPNDAPIRYNLACHYARIGETDRALDLLENSMNSRSWIEHDSDLDSIRDHPRYRAIIDGMRDE